MLQTDIRHPQGAGRWRLAALAGAMLLPSLGTSIANVALPSLAESFAASVTQVQWVVTVYLLAITGLIIVLGRLGDLMGRRRLLLVGMAVFTAASAACAAAPSLPLLVAARVAQGSGAAMVMALTAAFVPDLVPKARSGSAMGLLGTVSALGTALGPSLGGVLVTGFGWRAVFLVLVPLGVLVLLLAGWTLPAARAAGPAARERFDVPGAAILAVTLTAYVLAVSAEAVFLAVAALGAVLFVAVERRAASPLVRVTLLNEPRLAGGLLGCALIAAVVMATMVVGPFYLTRALGLDMAAAGAVMTVGPAVAALAGVPAGRAVDRFGSRRTSLAALAGIGAGALALALVPPRAGVPGYVAALGLLTACYALFQAANNAAIMAYAAQGERGVISALLTLSRNMGLVTGASAMGALFASAATAAGGMRLTFLVAAGLAVAAFAVVGVCGRGAEEKP